MAEFNPWRRVPEAMPIGYLYRKTLPLVGPFLRSSAWTVLGQWMGRSGAAGQAVQEVARERGDRAVELGQRVYFDAPGLDSLTMREAAKVGVVMARAGRVYAALTSIPLPGRARRRVTAAEPAPQTGFDALMWAGLAVGNTLGYFREGPVRTHLWWDSNDPNSHSLPPGHPEPAVRRFAAPGNLGDLAADIDDLYWADAYGQAVKVTQVGEGDRRRWLVSLPGTDNAELRSEPNVADLEANMQEELGIASAMRIGVIQVIHKAMNVAGVDPAARPQEKVLICGHSQGGIIAAALAAASPDEVGFAADAALTLGAPARRIVVRPEVTLVAVEHEQDIVPSLDGAPRKEADQRVVVRRRLNRPRRGALFFAHSSSTYTTTVRQIEKQHRVASWGRLRGALDTLQSYLPAPDEPVRVTHHYVWRDLTGNGAESSWESFLENQSHDTEMISFEGEVAVPPRPNAADLLQRVTKSLGQKTQGQTTQGQTTEGSAHE